MVVRYFLKTTTLSMILLCCLSCKEDVIYHYVDHPFIRIVNQSEDTLWVEMLNPREIEYFKGEVMDSMFYGIDQMVLPNSTKQIKSEFYPYWGGTLQGSTYIEENSRYVARVIIMDACAPTKIWHAREAQYKADSLRTIQMLKEFEQKHLLFKHWYAKEELNKTGWTIVYPQQKK